MRIEDELLKKILNGRAILITGAGAAYGVKNTNGDDFPSGVSLAKHLYKECNIDPEKEEDLADASETYCELHSDLQLITIIKSLLTIGNNIEDQKFLYSLPWLRCYTTNYDDIPLVSTKDCKKIIPVTMNSDFRKYREEKDLFIYINGYIGNLNENTLRNEFKLTGNSYLAADYILDSQWGSLLNEDLEVADVIVIIGLSLDYDLELKRIFYSETIKNKTIIIDSPTLTNDKARKLGRFGTVYSIGLNEFIKQINKISTLHTPVVLDSKYALCSCFSHEVTKIGCVDSPIPQDIYNLIMNGTYSNVLYHRVNGKFDSIVYRKEINQIVNYINEGVRTFFLHANLGNGKTAILFTLKFILINKGYHVFTLENDYVNYISKDISLIINAPGNKVVFIEDYFNYLHILEKFALYDIKNIIFILTARTMIYETKLQETRDILEIKENESVIIDANSLNYTELKQCSVLFTKNGLWGKLNNSLSDNEKIKILSNRRGGSSKFQNILIEIANSGEIKNRILDIVKEIKNKSNSYYETLILVLLSKVMSINLSLTDINKIMGVNAFIDPGFRKNSAVQEIIDFTNNKETIKVKSAITAKMIINELNCNSAIIDVLTKTAVYAGKYSKNYRYENILKNIVSYSHVNTFLNKKAERSSFLISYYDSLKDLDYYKNNVFFWIQYSIACMEIGEYSRAQKYIDVAYGSPNTAFFVPFQIDNQQARLYLELISNNKSEDMIGDLMKAHKLSIQPIISSKDREEISVRLFYYYTDKKFIKIIKSQGTECVQLFKQCCTEAYNRLNQYIPKIKVRSDKERYINLKNELLKLSI